MVKIAVRRFREIAEKSCITAGATLALAQSLIDATLSAEEVGRREVGIAHFPDYIESIRAGRIDGQADPSFEYPLPTMIVSDANASIAQLGFDRAFDELVRRANTFGMAILMQRNSYPAGEVGYYVRRLAQAGLVSLAVGNANAMMATVAGGARVYSTNPLAFGVPLEDGHRPIVIDQASSVTAFVNLARAAAERRTIPEGWAIDAAGAPTTDPGEGMLGALLPFGGYKGGNIALMVEMLAAGLTGAAWSLDAGSFLAGNQPPNTGLSVIAIRPPDAADFRRRATEQCRRLAEGGVHVPGQTSIAAFQPETLIEVDSELLRRILEGGHSAHAAR